MTRPRLLDLFCGAGGAAMGYHRAGFDVVGVDINPQPRYPFEFHQADAMEMLRSINAFGGGHGGAAHFDVIHASPPCQAYTIAGHREREAGKVYPDLVATVRNLLTATDVPWVIENVRGAPVRADYKLCGCMFGLPHLKRERWFETSWNAFDLRQPCYHVGRSIAVVSGGIQTWEIRDGWGRIPAGPLQELRSRAMGIDWMKRNDLALAIPPAYTEYIGTQLIDHLTAMEAA